MRGSDEDLITVAQRLGTCEIATSSRNWSTLHSATIMVIATMPPLLLEVGQRGHRALDEAFNVATPNPMEAENPDQVCVVNMAASFLLPLVACIDRVLRMHRSGNITLIGEEGQAEEMIANMHGARASFYEYLRSRDVGAEILFEE